MNIDVFPLAEFSKSHLLSSLWAIFYSKYCGLYYFHGGNKKDIIRNVFVVKYLRKLPAQQRFVETRGDNSFFVSVSDIYTVV